MIPPPAWLEHLRAKLGATLVETHISWVLLAGDRAYKFKKPVVLPFLDYGSLKRRRFFVDEELRLNRRYAPELYLGTWTPEGADGECAVAMRRFADDARLDLVCRRDALRPAHLSQLAALIVAFHAGAAVAGPASRFGEADQVLAPALENFDELLALGAGAAPEKPAGRQLPTRSGAGDGVLDALRTWTRAEGARLAPVFAARKAAGRVRECHGDLHLGNLALIDGRVTPFDCIEFNDDFRFIDVASEIAFTYVDLLDHRRPGLAGWWLNEWLAVSGDYDALAVLRFYAVYRLLVRAKVAALTADTADSDGYLHAAAGFIAPPRPRLAITHGVSGSGKTRASRELLLADTRAASIRLRSDVERKRRHGFAPDAASHSDLDAGLYTPAATEETYAALAATADRLLGEGWSVIVDATFLARAQRALFRALARRHGVEFGILDCRAPVGVLHRRLAARRGDASEADGAVLERQLARQEPLDAEERAERLPHASAGEYRSPASAKEIRDAKRPSEKA